MILTSTLENPAVLSNVGQVGEFRIRNSAKAFNILSSGLYANKIRAIIRELSCNAVDSHAAAGTADTPFEVHLPSQMEPYFAVRDFGTGLNHEQVTNIYTTYFESTKTASNEFIGALGLGSKSPFSYTDNFTVTAIQDGIKRIYSAFINEEGVPSIALMDTVGTSERNGVEVKFGVNDQQDYGKFQDEARVVFTYFKHRPTITGVSNFQFRDVEYEERDIIPGVHQTRKSYPAKPSMAVMGNIAYPIDVPNVESNFGNLAHLLKCGLEMHFDIGDLDFQASREGLSYIPQTMDNIRAKLIALNDRLLGHVTERAEARTNLWERADFLAGIVGNNLWTAAVRKYATDTNFVFADPNDGYGFLKSPRVIVEDLRTQYNLVLHAFARESAYGGGRLTTTLKSHSAYIDGVYKQCWYLTPSSEIVFVLNDTKVGAVSRARYHYGQRQKNQVVYVLEVADRSQPALFDQFLASIYNPPQVVWASDLDKKEYKRGNMNKVGVLELTNPRRERNGSRANSWKPADTVFNNTDTYYYLPLRNYEAACRVTPVSLLWDSLKGSGIDDISKIKVYGVRKNHIKEVESNPNWINLEMFLTERFGKMTDTELENIALNLVDKHELFYYTKGIERKLGVNSPARVLVEKVSKKRNVRNFDRDSLTVLLDAYAKNAGANIKFEKFVRTMRKECDQVLDRYPLLKYISGSSISPGGKGSDAIAQYINLIDNN